MTALICHFHSDKVEKREELILEWEEKERSDNRFPVIWEWWDHRGHSSFSSDPPLFRSVTAMAVGVPSCLTFTPAKYLSLFLYQFVFCNLVFWQRSISIEIHRKIINDYVLRSSTRITFIQKLGYQFVRENTLNQRCQLALS